MRTIAIIVLALVVTQVLGPRAALAQEAPPRHLAASVGVFSYKLAESGVAPMVAVRASTPVSTVLVIEAGIAASRPDQVGNPAMFLAPEVQAQLALPFEAFVPYMGLGFGAVIDFGGPDAGGSQFDISFSGTLGMRAWVNERLGIQGEFRGRGIGYDFATSASEYSLGLAWRL